MDAQDDTLKEDLLRLRTTILEYDIIVSILSRALKKLHLDASKQQDDANEKDKTFSSHSLTRYISQYQTTILQFIIPHWLDQLKENDQLSLVKAFFVPNLFPLDLYKSAPSYQSKIECVISAHVTLLTPPLSQFAVNILGELRSGHSNSTTSIGLVNIFKYLFDSQKKTQGENSRRWDDYLSSLFSIYGRIGNAASDGHIKILEGLYANNFIKSICDDFVRLCCCPEYNPENDSHTESSSSLLGRLVTVGAFPAAPPAIPTIPSFWATILSRLRQEFIDQISGNRNVNEMPASRFQKGFISSLSPLPLSQQLTVINSLLSHLEIICKKSGHEVSVGIDSELDARGVVKREAELISYIVGDFYAAPIIHQATSSQEARRTGGDSDDEDLDDFNQNTSDSLPRLWSMVSVILGRPLSIELPRLLVCWAGISRHREQALNLMLDRALDLWSNADHIKHSTLARHQALTCLLLTTVAELSPSASSNSGSSSSTSNEVMKSLSRKAQLITAVGAYISHLDMNVRRCGMLVAEVIAHGAGGKLEFPGWEGEEEGQKWARQIRVLITRRDSEASITVDLELTEHGHQTDADPAIAQDGTLSSQMAQSTLEADTQRIRILENAEDSDDSLEGYESSSTSSSRAASPIPTTSTGAKANENKNDIRLPEPTIDEINKDPSLFNPQKKRVRKPVYLLELGKLLKEGKEGEEQSENIGMALNTGATLIRRKAGWGTELEENAVDLTINFMGLQNNYEFEAFEQKVLEALTALVACCPRKVAPCIIEHFFTPNYSTSHRYNMLNALALGARELAGLPTPQVPSVSQSFPSKLLPPSLHAKYVRKEDVDPYDNGSQVKALAEGISSLAIEKGQKDAEEKVPEIARERHLTVQGMRKTLKPGAIVELDAPKYGQALSSSIARSAPQTQPKTSFTEVAAEHFLVPLLSQFWAYLRDMLSREEHASRFSSRSRGGYAAAGTGMILSPLVLSHFLNTVAILAHASRHSPAFLSVISPGVLELTVTLGTRKMSTNEDTDSSSRGTSTGATGAASFMEQESKKAASVLRASLELAIVALDGIIDVDGGKVLALEHGPLFANVVAWAEKVFTVVDKGISLEGIGGGEEGRLFRASSGLVLKVEEIKNKWRQSMLIPY